MIKMRCQTFCAPLGALPVVAPFRGFASHQFTGGFDFMESLPQKPFSVRLLERVENVKTTTNKTRSNIASLISDLIG